MSGLCVHLTMRVVHGATVEIRHFLSVGRKSRLQEILKNADHSMPGTQWKRHLSSRKTVSYGPTFGIFFGHNGHRMIAGYKVRRVGVGHQKGPRARSQHVEDVIEGAKFLPEMLGGTYLDRVLVSSDKLRHFLERYVRVPGNEIVSLGFRDVAFVNKPI